MLNQHSIARLAAAVSAVALVALATGCSKPADQAAQAPPLHRLPTPARYRRARPSPSWAT